MMPRSKTSVTFPSPRPNLFLHALMLRLRVFYLGRIAGKDVPFETDSLRYLISTPSNTCLFAAAFILALAKSRQLAFMSDKIGRGQIVVDELKGFRVLSMVCRKQMIFNGNLVLMDFVEFIVNLIVIQTAKIDSDH